MKTNTEILHPAVNSVFEFTVNAGQFRTGIVYVISGFGVGKPKGKDLERPQFWEVLEKYNTTVGPKYIWRKELFRLFEEGKAAHTLRKL